MYLEFYGAADGVTGSLHRLHVNGNDILLDCGLFQGRRAESVQRNLQTPPWATEAHALVLSHAHIDHSGNIPTIVKRGFSGNVFCTPPTRDLCSVMLRDSAMLQAQDARHLNRRYRREGRGKHIEPLYDVDDAQQAVSRMVSIPLHRPMEIAPGVRLTFHNSGHVLGSALVQLDLMERGKKARFLFTGDLGRDELPLLKSPEIVAGVEILLIESTYGDRVHPDIATMDQQLATIVRGTIDRGGKVFIPSFALERAQEVLFALERLHEAGQMPRVPIYIDSPLAIAITEIYKLHPDGLDDPVRTRILGRDDPFAPPGLHYVSDIESSRRLQESSEPCIIIAGSGMCEGGRILHHFAGGLGDARNSVVIVGFMAQHTLGRKLCQGSRKVKVFGVEREVHAPTYTIAGLSAHADRDDLSSFVKRTAHAGSLRRVFLVHGEERARNSLAALLGVNRGLSITQASVGQRVEL